MPHNCHMENFKARLKSRQKLIGPVVSLASPEVAEVFALLGFDYIWIDMEHAPLEFSQVQGMIQAVAGRSACLVRVPDNGETWIKKALDMGADGVIVPQVRDAEAARRAVEYSHYPPQGRRGAGVARAQGYGLGLREYLESANENISLVLQIEDREGAENIPSIARVPGVDAIVIGPLDLSTSLGVPGQLTHPLVLENITSILRHCQSADMCAGIFTVDAENAKIRLEQGFTMIVMGIDLLYLWGSARQALTAVRSSIT